MNGKITFSCNIYMPVYMFCRFLPDSCEFPLSDRGPDKKSIKTCGIYTLLLPICTLALGVRTMCRYCGSSFGRYWKLHPKSPHLIYTINLLYLRLKPYGPSRPVTGITLHVLPLLASRTLCPWRWRQYLLPKRQ
jgi:hypothetical protein